MGSSKKSKDKDRKKRKRERSRSKERHRHHHKHKKHKRSREDASASNEFSDVSISDTEFEPQKKKIRAEPNHGTDHQENNVVAKPVESGNNSNVLSLSVEETNKMRIKLGLKPLQEETRPKAGGDIEEGEYKPGQEIHQAPENIGKKLEVEKLREKVAAQKEKRLIKDKLKHVKTLGESDDDESSTAWINKSRQIEKEKQEAIKRQKMLEEVDAQFEIDNLVQQEIKQVKKNSYSSRNLSGLKIQHDVGRFDEGQATILTLKDSNVLDEEEDTLVNVNIVDQERVEKNLKNKKEKPDAIEYDAPEMDEDGNLVQKTVLTKYDEEIGGEKSDSFRIGSGGVGATSSSKEDELAKAKRVAKLRQLVTLGGPAPQLATEYMTPGELTFKKTKRKKKKKKFCADELLPVEDDGTHHGSRNTKSIKNLSKLIEEETEPMDIVTSDTETHDVELQEAIARSRRVKDVKKWSTDMTKQVEELEANPHIQNEADNNMTLNLTDEFCRTLGEMPTYGRAGNRTEEDASVLMDTSPVIEEKVEEPNSAWEEVGIDNVKVDIDEEETAPILEEEPSAGGGVAAALALATKKGYLEKDTSKKTANAALQHLRAVHYSIDDKAAEDDRRSGRGDRYMGPTIDFREKDGYKPDVKLEYVDDEGRKLNEKEAFRYLSHKFHGKGSGKNKLEKRMKKWQEESLMKHMSSSDTPLQTLERQREKQKQMGSAYLVLSGNRNLEGLDVKK